MIKMSKNLCFIYLFISSLTYALDEIKIAKEITEEINSQQSSSQEETQIIIENSQDAGVKKLEIEKYSYTTAMYDDPLLASGLASGVNLLNKSIDSIIESIFYNLLDNKIKVVKFSDQSGFFVQTSRDTYDLPSGAYVIIDKFSLGPEYSSTLKVINGVPILLGVDGKIGVFDIYIRNDVMRAADNIKLSWFRRLINNWFGLLPFLSRILPPSFNEHEMYDPIKVVQPAFVFPLSVEAFRKMKMGSIASYNISGGVRVPVLLHEKLSSNIKDVLNNFSNFQAIFPYSVFIKGEYRINVLRKSSNIAWVGVTKIHRYGHTISPSIGNVLRVFTNIFKGWGGVPLLFFPFNAEYEQARAHEFHNLYEFDLSNPKSHKAYEDAVKGDFALAHQKYLQYLQEGENSGVYFHFNLNDDSRNLTSTRRSYLLALNTEINADKTISEIKVEDAKGNFYVLKAQKNLKNKFFEIFTGKELNVFSFSSSLQVNKTEDEQGNVVYELKLNHPNPIEFLISFEFKDNYVDSSEYKNYLKLLRYFLALPLAGAPDLPYREKHLVNMYTKKAVFSNPSKSIMRLHVPYTYLGKIGAVATIKLNYALIKKICSYSENQLWQAFAMSYELDSDYWGLAENREAFINKLKTFTYYAYYPLKIFNFKVAYIDFVHETSSAVSALLSIKKAISSNDVPELLNSIYKLFNTEYPVFLARTLVFLAGVDNVPRSVSFYTTAKGKASNIIKDKFRSLNNKVFKSIAADTENIENQRYSQVVDKLSNFNPSQVEDISFKPILRKIIVESKYSPSISFDYYFDKKDAKIGKDVLITIFSEGMSAINDGYFYVRVEDVSSKLNFTNSVIAEKVIRLSPLTLSKEESQDFYSYNVLKYQFWLTGEFSPLEVDKLKDISNLNVKLKVYISASKNLSTWSDSKEIIFYLQNGKVYEAN